MDRTLALFPHPEMVDWFGARYETKTLNFVGESENNEISSFNQFQRLVDFEENFTT